MDEPILIVEDDLILEERKLPPQPVPDNEIEDFVEEFDRSVDDLFLSQEETEWMKGND